MMGLLFGMIYLKMAELSSRTNPTGYKNEHIIPESMSAEQAYQLIVDTSGVPLVSN